MKTLKHVVSIVALALLACVTSYAQQNTLTQTTLTAAVNDSANTVRVTAATNITAAAGGTSNTLLFIDNEAMSVTSVNGLVIGVTRGANGTRANAHSNAAVVLAGRPQWFGQVDQSGACTPANVVASPFVNTTNGNQWLCSTVLNKWVPGWGNPGNSGSPIGVTTAVASAAGTITPSGPLFHITGTAAITGFVIPVGFNGGEFCVIPDGAFTTTTAGNIAIASTATTSRTICWTYDKNAAKPFFASY